VYIVELIHTYISQKSKIVFQVNIKIMRCTIHTAPENMLV